MELYKIVARGDTKHFYESLDSFIRGRKYHVKWLNQVKEYLSYLTVDCYMIGIDKNGQINWTKLYSYVVQKGKVVQI